MAIVLPIVYFFIQSTSPLNPPFGRNFYTEYNQVKKQNLNTEFLRSKALRFVTEDARFANVNVKTFNDNTSLLEQTLEIRFTIYNNSSSKIKIFNFQCVVYLESGMQIASTLPRTTIDISPENPFILQNITYDIEPQQSKSFLIKFTAKIGDGIVFLDSVLGVFVYYHSPIGEIGKIKSDNLLLVKFKDSSVKPFNELIIQNNIEKIKKSLDQDPDLKKEKLDSLLKMMEYLKKHQTL
jgi:hypothetical protein